MVSGQGAVQEQGKGAGPQGQGAGPARAMAAEAAERQLELLRDEREAEVAQSRCDTRDRHRTLPGTRHRPPGTGHRPPQGARHRSLRGYGAVTAGDTCGGGNAGSLSPVGNTEGPSPRTPCGNRERSSPGSPCQL